ncbi:hypothetical protein [Spirillospora sp. CA-128828]|uniref:hypothetical protein n=1 Tax=Spirillospora sp. CA-128828 TaxID=3240033 RepID=UPI003D9187FD
MATPNETRHRTANRRQTSLAPDDVLTINLPGDVTATIDMLDQTVTVEGRAGGWKVTDRRKRNRNT